MVERTVEKIKLALLYLIFIIIGGSFGYMFLEGWSFTDSLYMTIITISTTGFKEVHPLTVGGRIFTIIIIVLGVTTLAYAGGRVAQFFIETQIFRRRRMTKKLSQLRNHYIVCGYGRMGKKICQELLANKVNFVVIENNSAEIHILNSLGILYVAGDATDDSVLTEANIQAAKGLVAALRSEAENVFTTLSSKVLNPDIFVVARAVEEKTESKLRKAGANRVVKPYEIGGHRMAQVLLRPGVVDFIDIVARDKQIDLNIEEVLIIDKSPLSGQTLMEAPIRNELNIIIVAIYQNNGDINYNPKSDSAMQIGDRLIVIGEQDNITQLRILAGHKS